MGNIQNKEYYDNAYLNRDGYDLPYKESEYYFLWREVVKYIEEKAYILELGCGTGQFAHMLFDNGFINYTGVDFSDVAIEKAKSKVNFPFFVRNILKEEAYGYIYDTIIALEVLEHTHDLKVVKSLRKGIDILFTVPNFDDPAHLRHFKDCDCVYNRYENYIDFEFIFKLDKYFFCKGVIR